MGLKTLSMHPASLPEVKKLIRELELRQLTDQVEKLLHNLSAPDLAEHIEALGAHSEPG